MAAFRPPPCAMPSAIHTSVTFAGYLYPQVISRRSTAFERLAVVNWAPGTLSKGPRRPVKVHAALSGITAGPSQLAPNPTSSLLKLAPNPGPPETHTGPNPAPPTLQVDPAPSPPQTLPDSSPSAANPATSNTHTETLPDSSPSATNPATNDTPTEAQAGASPVPSQQSWKSGSAPPITAAGNSSGAAEGDHSPPETPRKRRRRRRGGGKNADSESSPSIDARPVDGGLGAATAGNGVHGAEGGNGVRVAEGEGVTDTDDGPLLIVSRPLPRVLLLHTGGTLGMELDSFSVLPDGHVQIKPGTGGTFTGTLRPGEYLSNLLSVVPELRAFANMSLRVVFNRDSCRVVPADWIQLAKILHEQRDVYDAFLVVHGTDTMAYTAAALSVMLAGFGKPIILTGSQLPLLMPRSDARQNLVDSITCATSYFSPPHVHLTEVAICFGGRLMRGNRAQKVNSSVYQAFDTPTYPHLASLGVEVEWNKRFLLQVEGGYRPRFVLDPRVIRVPIVPGSDPRMAYGDLYGRGVRGIVLEAFGVGNMPDLPEHGWLPWLEAQVQAGLQVYLTSQCLRGTLQPDLYRSGAIAMQMGVQAGPLMTPECAVVKMMLCLAYPNIPMTISLAGEL